jgi:type III secretion protein V
MTAGILERGVLSLRLELPEALAVCADNAAGLKMVLCEAIDRHTQELLDRLGIPAEAGIAIAVGPMQTEGEPMRLSLGATRFRYSRELLQRLYSYIREEPLDPLVNGERITRWLREHCSTAGTGDDARTAVEFIALACVEMLKTDPAALLGPDQARAYGTLLTQATTVPGDDLASTLLDPIWLTEVLAEVLSLGISIADVNAMAKVIPPGRADDRSLAQVTEDVIEASRPDVIEIQMATSLLREMTTGMGADDARIFPFLREGLFEELGLELPRFRFVAIDTMRPQMFRFKVNHLESLPFRALSPAELLVNDTADRLRLTAIDATPTINPASGQPGSIVDVSRKDQAIAMGLTTWNQVQHLVLCLADHLRQNGYGLAHRQWVRGRLRSLRSWCPALVTTVLARWSDDDITGLVRDLLLDGVSVGNWRAILDSLVELDAAKQEPSDLMPPWRKYAHDHPLAFVRIGLGRHIAHTAARQTCTVVVYLLDPAIERAVGTPSSLSSETAEAILEAFAQEMAALPPTAQRPHVLTVLEVRRPLQNLLRTRFPRISVIAHEELPPGVNVQPVARIQLA